MRFFLLLAALGLLFGVATAAPLPANTAAAIRIDRLPATGFLLSRGWRYHAGDDPAWARPDFDDSGWDTLNPARPRRELPAPGLSRPAGQGQNLQRHARNRFRAGFATGRSRRG